MEPRSIEKGSALIIILIAVVLFAALSFVVAQMMRGDSEQNLSHEKINLAASEILEFSQSVRQGTQQLRISNNCSDNDISFETTTLAGYAHSPPVSDSCKLFSGSGGGLTYLAPQAVWLNDAHIADLTYGKYAFVRQMAVDSIGTSDSDLTMVLNYVQKDVCVEINDHLGITNTNDLPPKDVGAFHSTELFVGSYDTTTDLVDAPEVKGKNAGCVQSSDGSNNMFYQVLLAR